MNEDEIKQYKFLVDVIMWLGKNGNTPQSDELYDMACQMKGSLAKEMGYRLIDEYATCKGMK